MSHFAFGLQKMFLSHIYHVIILGILLKRIAFVLGNPFIVCCGIQRVRKRPIG